VLEIPMFPLNTPVLPHTALPLHVFEDRYRRMMHDVMGSDRTLGFVMIERGSEVGGGDVRTGMGTLARVVEAEELEDGRWLLIAVGLQRLRVIEWLPDDPYPAARVEVLEAGTPGSRPDMQTAVRRIAALAAELELPGPPIDVELSGDPVAAAYQALASAPVGPLDIQRILEIDDPDERIAAVVLALEEAEQLLRLRLAGGSA
jgi:hypothetical protein